MGIENIAIVVSLLGSALITLVVAGFAAGRRALPGARWFMLMMLAAAQYTLLEATAFAVPDVVWKTFCIYCEYLGAVSIAPLWLMFCAEHTGRTGWLSGWRLGLLWVIPVTVLAMAFCNPLHGLIWSSISPFAGPGGTRLVFEYGSVGWTGHLYKYLLFFIGSAWLLSEVRQAPVLFRRQSAALVLAGLLICGSNLAYVVKITPVQGLDLTPFGFPPAGVVLIWAILRFQFLSLSPVAHFAIFRSMSSGALVLNPQGRIVDLNPAARRLLGAGEPAIGRRAAEFLPDWPASIFDPSQNQPDHVEVHTGAYWYEVQGSSLGERKGTPSGRVVVFNDITERKHIEDQLRAREAALSGLAAAGQHLLGDPEKDASIVKALGALGRAVKADRIRVFENHADASGLLFMTLRFEWVEDGIPAQINNPVLQHLRYGDGFSRWATELGGGGVIAGHVRDFPADERAILSPQGIQSMLAVPVHVEHAFWGLVSFDACSAARTWAPAEIEVLRAAAHAVGNTLLRRRLADETARLKDRLVQAQRIEGLGRLAGGVAHDFNNMLQAILGFSDLLELGLEPGDPRLADLNQIRQAGRRLSTLTRQLLAFGRRQIIRPEALDLNRQVADAVTLLGPLLGTRIQIRLNFDDALPPVRADAGQLQQVLLNLALNARDAMPGGGILSVETRAVDIRAGHPEATPDSVPGPYLRLTVADTGMGMSRAVLDHLFEPFFTTKPQGAGSGMGLPAAHGIVHQHGGFIRVETEEGRGTRMHVYLPALPKGTAITIPAAIAPAQPASGAGTGERILLVEDEHGVRLFASRLLLKAGYQVFDAPDVRTAVEIFEREGRSFDLLFSDVVLPDGNGVELAHDLIRRKPGLKILLSSGYSDDLARWPEIKKAHWAFLPKPYVGSEMLGWIKAVIHGWTAQETAPTPPRPAAK